MQEMWQKRFMPRIHHERVNGEQGGWRCEIQLTVPIAANGKLATGVLVLRSLVHPSKKDAANDASQIAMKWMDSLPTLDSAAKLTAYSL